MMSKIVNSHVFQETKRFTGKSSARVLFDWAASMLMLAGMILVIVLANGCGDNIRPPMEGGDDDGTVFPTDDGPDAGIPPEVQDPGDAGQDAGTTDGQETPDGATDPTGPTVPEAPPTVSVIPLPTTALANGMLTAYRFVLTAPAESDVTFRKLSFAIEFDSDGQVVQAVAPRLREVGSATNLSASIDSQATLAVHCGDDGGRDVCHRVVLDEAFTVAAGTSRTLDLRVSVNADFSAGDTMTTSLYRDAAAADEGVLTGTGLETAIKDGIEDGLLWSNDGVWFYNGHDVIGTPVAQTLTR